MAFLGFAVLVIVGVWLLIQGVMGFIVMSGLSGRPVWGVLTFAVLGVGALVLACFNAPFNITMSGG